MTDAPERIWLPFQQRVLPWLRQCFGSEISADRSERSHRFLEEALELVQACGCTAADAHALVEYVYSRDVGEIRQEVGGVMVTLAALCLAQQEDMHECGEIELSRVWGKIEKIREKQAAKPKGSALPQQWSDPADRHRAEVAAAYEDAEEIALGANDVRAAFYAMLKRAQNASLWSDEELAAMETVKLPNETYAGGRIAAAIAVRARTPDDARAALDALLKEARREVLESLLPICKPGDVVGPSMYERGALDAYASCYDRLRVLIDKEEW